MILLRYLTNALFILPNVLNTGLRSLYRLLAAQSPARLFLLFQAFLLLLYALMAIAAAYVLPKNFSGTRAIRVHASREKVWDHLCDIVKNPLSSSMHVKTTRLSETEWQEDIGSGEIVVCTTVEEEKPRRMVRKVWAEAVSMKGEWTCTLEESGGDNKTIVRIYVTVETLWGSFMTPLLRFVMTFRKSLLEQGVKDYLDRLCKDMAADYEVAEAWE